ncbi:MAG TPA: phosphotransferase [Solirubrobacteraceae bacterium]|jgi:Ser/Thr protein kinase RdoA (MazF antagonist)|nr:phosphotransferase [Solirubrobacteraceae bacterium]
MSSEPTIEITEERLQSWLDQFVSDHIDRFSLVTVGLSNVTYAVTCASGERYVVRKLDSQATSSVTAEALIQQTLVERGLSSPLYLPSHTGEFVGRDGGNVFTVSRHLAGEHPASLTLELAASFGETLAQIHDALDATLIDLPENRGQWLNPRNVVAEITRCPAPAQAKLQPILERSAPLFDAELPQAIIHGELAANNVFAAAQRVTTIFDFENAEHAPRLLDLAYTYVSMVYDEQLDPAELLSALRGGYDGAAEMPLTPVEIAEIPRAVGFTATAASAWCHARGMSDYGEQFLRSVRDPSVQTATRSQCCDM